MTRAVFLLSAFSGLTWFHSAQALIPSSPEQLMCLPAAFVVASITDAVPSGQGPTCDLNAYGSCTYALTLTAKVRQILATRPAEPGAALPMAIKQGENITATISVFQMTGASDAWAQNESMGLVTPVLSREATLEAIRGHDFIFGIGSPHDFGQLDHIWSLSYQKDLEKTLMRDTQDAVKQKVADRCATLVEPKQLEDAAAKEPTNLARLLALAAFHERVGDGKALSLYRDATAFDQNNRALEGFIRSLGTPDAAWTTDGLEMAHTILLKDPKNPVARRLLVQSWIHLGQMRLVDGADLSLGSFGSLDLSGQTLPGVKLADTFVERLEADGAKLLGGDLSGIRIRWSELRNADLRGARLDRADLGQAAIAGADFSSTRGPVTMSSRGAAGASFENADLNGSDIQINQGGIGFPSAQFYGGWLDDEDDQPTAATAKRPSVNFSHAHLRNAGLRVDGLRIDFSYADLTGATVDLTDLRGANLSGAVLDHTSFRETVYDCETVWPKGFNPEDEKLIPLPGPDTCKQQLPLVYRGLLGDQLNLAGLDLRKASFQGVQRGRLRLVGADLSGVDLRGVDFKDAILDGARFDGALYDGSTGWPQDFDPKKAGARFCASGPSDRCK